MTIAQGLLLVAGAMLTVAAGFALYRLAKGPSSLDRGVASDVVLVIMAVAAALHAAWTHTSMALVLSLVLSLLGFTSAVGLARLITRTTEQERHYREAEARAARGLDGRGFDGQGPDGQEST